jgi:hypothetical protein
MERDWVLKVAWPYFSTFGCIGIVASAGYVLLMGATGHGVTFLPFMYLAISAVLLLLGNAGYEQEVAVIEGAEKADEAAFTPYVLLIDDGADDAAR